MIKFYVKKLMVFLDNFSSLFSVSELKNFAKIWYRYGGGVKLFHKQQINIYKHL
jgi:hypothetical protein